MNFAYRACLQTGFNFNEFFKHIRRKAFYLLAGLTFAMCVFGYASADMFGVGRLSLLRTI